MAADGYEALTAEIERITSSPYPSQLRTLRDIATKCSDASIAYWAASRPCLIDTLASCLLEGLQQWPYVLDIITKFALNAACRNAFLQQEPTLLHSVVAQAVKIGDGKSKYARASVALLSRSLPNTVALPAEIQTLFVQLVEEAARRPSAVTIEPIYLLLNGTGSLLLGLLSTDVLVRFEEHLLDILKNAGNTPDQSLSLYCLSIMNVVCCSIDPEFRLTASSYTSQDFLASTPTSSRWKSEAMQQFFTGSRAQKSIQLIVLNVLWAASNSTTSGESSSEKTTCLVLANEIISAIPLDLRKNWCTANTIAVRKLQEKLCNHTQDETAKTLGLRFLGKLCELDSLPHVVLQSVEMTFLEPKSVQIAYTLCPRTKDCELFSGVLARAPISILLQNAVDYAARAESLELASGLEALTQMIRVALIIIEEERITGHEIRATLNDSAFTQSLERLRDRLEQPTALNSEPTNPGWCQTALHRARSSVAHQISILLLRACHSSSMSPQPLTLLLSLHACSAKGELQCSHDRISWREHDILPQSKHEDVEDVGDWREALHTHFKARAQVEQDAVARLFARACSSLEARCEHVEKPLREEQQKRQTLEERNEALQRAFAELEARSVDSDIQIRALEEQRDGHVDELEEYRNENSDLLSRVAQLEKQLQGTQAQIAGQIEEFRKSKQMLELESAAAVARKQEELEDMEAQLGQATSAAATKSQEMERLKGDLTATRSERNQLENHLTSANARLQDLQNSIDNVERNKGDLAAQSASLERELSITKNDLTTRVQELARIQQQLQDSHAERDDLRASFERELADLREDFNSRYEEACAQTKHEQGVSEDLERQLAHFHHEQEEAQDQFTADLEARNAKISDLKKKADRLQRKCEQKDQQIAEAEAMRANLMAAMGISGGHSALPHRSRDSFAQTQEDPTPPTPTSENIEMPDATPAEPKSSSERTPKRPRPRKSVPATKTGSRVSTQSLHPAKRQTLGVLSGNQNRVSPRPQVSFKAPMKGVEDEDGSTFEGSELFSGTQAAQMADLGKAFDGETLS